MKRALVIQRLKFGDIAQTLPALAALRSQHPDWEIWVLGRGRYVTLLERAKAIDRVVSTGPECAVTNAAAVERCAQDIVRDLPGDTWELVANLSHDPVAGRVATLLPARSRSGLLVDARGERSLAGDAVRYLFGAVGARRLGRIHLSDIYSWALGAQAQRVTFPLLEPSSEDLETVRSKLHAAGWDDSRQLVLFQLGTAAPERRWPVHLFARLGRMLATFPGIQIALIGSDDERALAEAYLQLAPGTALDLVGQIPIQELPALSRLSATLVGADTGPTHIAAAAGADVVGIYHATAWVHETGPYGEGHVVLQADLQCSPCFQRTACTEKPCAVAVQPEHVIQALVWRGILPEDEVPEEFLSAPWTNVRAFASEMQAWGVGYRQIAGEFAPAEELLAAANQAAAHELWFGTAGSVDAGFLRQEELPGDSPFAEMRDLLALAELADEGATYAGQILRSVRNVSKVGKKLNNLARKLDDVDAGIRDLGDGAALVRSYLVETQKLLPGGDLVKMARESEKAYATAAQWARLAAQWLERWVGEREEANRGEAETEREAVAEIQ
ncbi:MAG: glycosyltransferase family 9 protein [Calditrichaeota bacterium]|nr:glycosyltransferase family 9 protein [Calditrichota bacterium]